MDHEDEEILECEIFDSTLRTAYTKPIAHSFISKLKSHPSNLLDSIFDQPVLLKANQKCCIAISIKQNAHFRSGKPSMVQKSTIYISLVSFWDFTIT